MIPVVLSGGMGTRLWPLSRATFPKQFCELLDESLLEKSLKRLKPLGSPWTLTTIELETLTKKIFKELELDYTQIVFEPMARNTAPAIALLCRILELHDQSQEIVGIFPADHLVTNEKEFLAAVRLAIDCAGLGQVATLGIRPESPATGFGYIEVQNQNVFHSLSFESGDVRAPKPARLDAFQTKGFREKPDLKTAQQFVEAGTFFWNAGIFVFQVQTMAKHLATLLPDVWNPLSGLKKDLSNLKDIYATLPSISIDYGVMERLAEQVCVPCDIGWSDLGSWDDVAKFGQNPTKAIAFSNHAEVIQAGTAKNNFVFSTKQKVYGLVDVNDIIVVETPDATLITKRGSSQDVRKVVDQLNDKKHVTAREHPFDIRPWGAYTVLRDEAYYKSKVIRVDAGSQISYQSHTKRNEHWIIVRGEAEVMLNEKTHRVKSGESVYVPSGMKHRIRNPGPELLEFIEVQTGTYFGEDDIVRYLDDYNRI